MSARGNAGRRIVGSRQTPHESSSGPCPIWNPPLPRYAVRPRLRDRAALLEQVVARVGGVGGRRRLAHCDGRMGWPDRGVYFFFEDGETRAHSGGGPRVVRVGTHALKSGSRSSLWGRLAQHRGVAREDGGNHRGSIFRLLVGASLARRDPSLAVEGWGRGYTAPREVRAREHDLERRVSEVIGRMPFVWLDVPDEPGRDSLRGVAERFPHGREARGARQPRRPGDRPLLPHPNRWCGRRPERFPHRWCRCGRRPRRFPRRRSERHSRRAAGSPPSARGWDRRCARRE